MTVVVLASLNADLVVPVDVRPTGGQTVLGGELVVHCGGKGGNTAAAAALAGADVRVIGRVGDDEHGRLLRRALIDVGADVTTVVTTPGSATGVALITVTPDGENSIVVAPGANGRVGQDDIGDLTGVDVAVVQLEVPLGAVTALARACAASGTRFVLNAAPPQSLDPLLLQASDPLVVNTHEAAALTGLAVPADVDDALGAGAALREQGAKSVVLTMGGGGALVVDATGAWHVAAPHVDAVVDTTGAGDCLVGTLAARLAAGDDLPTAVADAVRTATLAVLEPGAQSSYVPRHQALAVPTDAPRPLRGTVRDAGSSKSP